MDDYEPWLTPCDPDFDPEKCERAALTAISVRPVAAATSAAASDLSASNSSSASVQWRYPAASTIAAPILV